MSRLIVQTRLGSAETVHSVWRQWYFPIVTVGAATADADADCRGFPRREVGGQVRGCETRFVTDGHPRRREPPRPPLMITDTILVT